MSETVGKLTFLSLLIFDYAQSMRPVSDTGSNGNTMINVVSLFSVCVVTQQGISE